MGGGPGRVQTTQKSLHLACWLPCDDNRRSVRSGCPHPTFPKSSSSALDSASAARAIALPISKCERGKWVRANAIRRVCLIDYLWSLICLEKEGWHGWVAVLTGDRKE